MDESPVPLDPVQINHFQVGDCLQILKQYPDNFFDLTFCSPPYEDARTYGIGLNLTGQKWVDWAVPIYLECLRVTKGLVAWVVEGRTKRYRYSATPALLMADLHRAGVHLRKPPIYKRDGIPGSGGPDWLKNRYEFIVCGTKGGPLPWSQNTAMGHPPKCRPGGNPSHRQKNGNRVTGKPYRPPALANPGNIIDCGAAGGGNIGDAMSHTNEAPFPEFLAEFFIKSFCPPGGVVLDPFSGSGTTAVAAVTNNRNFIGIEIRQDQVDNAHRRLWKCTAS